MRSSSPSWTRRVAVVAAVAFAAAGAMTPARGAARRAYRVVERPVVFDVTNSNTSAVPCTADGGRYQVQGTLVGSDSELSAPRAAIVTVYLHGFNVAGWMWAFKSVPGYDYAAAMAQRGQVSLVLDRLGYLPSSQPAGMQTCFGAEADILHQIIQQLRAGSYTIQGEPPKQFHRVVTAGQDVGGLIVEVEAYSYHDIDGLALLGWADQGFTTDAFPRWSAEVVSLCAQGGQPAQPNGPGGYFRFIQSDAELRAKAFPYTDPSVADAIFRDIQLNPCGDFQSITTAIDMDIARLHDVAVPVLNLYPDHDLVITPQGYQLQGLDFAPNPNVTTIGIQAGHFPMLERSPSQVFQTDVSEWLDKEGF